MFGVEHGQMLIGDGFDAVRSGAPRELGDLRGVEVVRRRETFEAEREQIARHDGVRGTYISLGAVKNRPHGGDEDWKLTPRDVGAVILSLLRLPDGVLVPYLDARPLRPKGDSHGGIERLQYA